MPAGRIYTDVHAVDLPRDAALTARLRVFALGDRRITGRTVDAGHASKGAASFRYVVGAIGPGIPLISPRIAIPHAVAHLRGELVLTARGGSCAPALSGHAHRERAIEREITSVLNDAHAAFRGGPSIPAKGLLGAKLVRGRRLFLDTSAARFHIARRAFTLATDLDTVFRTLVSQPPLRALAVPKRGPPILSG
jgi:hypothetical protein